MDSLRKLPSGSVYTKKSGNARVTASIKGDSLLLTAETDSTPELNYTEEENLVHIRDQLSEQAIVKESASTPFWDCFKYCLNGILLISILVIIQQIYKWTKRDQ